MKEQFTEDSNDWRWWWWWWSHMYTFMNHYFTLTTIFLVLCYVRMKDGDNKTLSCWFRFFLSWFEEFFSLRNLKFCCVIHLSDVDVVLMIDPLAWTRKIVTMEWVNRNLRLCEQFEIRIWCSNKYCKNFACHLVKLWILFALSTLFWSHCCHCRYGLARN